MKRIIVSILILIMALAIQVFFFTVSFAAEQFPADSKGPMLGKWTFEGKDDKGIVWKGTLTVAKLDTASFDANRYYSGCILDISSNDGGKGVDAPCTWNAAGREVSFGAGSSTYTAVLSSDGKTLTQGNWTETEKDFRTRKVTIKSTGNWSAKYTGQ